MSATRSSRSTMCNSDIAAADQTLQTAERGLHASNGPSSKGKPQFDPAVERKLRLKIDLFILPIVFVMYTCCFIDRTNLGNAKIAHLERDLGFTGYDFNKIITIFYVSYIVLELPANLLCKYVGPGWFIPISVCLFGGVSMSTAYVHNFAQMAGVRFLLGMFEAGLLPGIAYYLSRWYRRSELVFRLACYIISAPLAGAFGGLLASAILTLDEVAGVKEWRMLFIIEGLATIILGFIALFILTDRPETARWLTAEEKEMVIARVQMDRDGATDFLDKIDKTKVMRGILNPVTLGSAFIFLLCNITVQSYAIFLPTIVETIYSSDTVVRQQLLTAPPYLLGAATTIPITYLSWRLDTRQIFMYGTAPIIVVGYAMFLGCENPTVRYAATFIIASVTFPNGALTSAQAAANVVSDTARNSAIGFNIMMGNVGGLIAGWAFLPWDAPNFHIGNGLNLAVSGTLFISGAIMHVYMIQDNKRRDKLDVDHELRGLTQQQIDDLDWKHPEFRWKP